jgi:GNAT superfamily N-acetyltransferase
MIDARRYRVEETLRNGVAVEIRAVRPEDRDRIAAAFRELDRESVYRRFFSYKRDLSAAELAQIDTMDFVRDVMLVVTTCKGDDDILIASARYIADDTDEGLIAEVAFTVEEDYQGLGIARRLISHLATIAREFGVVGFTAEVLPQNKAMLAAFAKCGLPMHQRRESGVVHVSMALGQPN